MTTNDHDSYDDDLYDETDTTVEEFDAMWEVGESVEIVEPPAQPVMNYVLSFAGGYQPETAGPTLAAFDPRAQREPLTTEPVAREAVSLR